MQAATYGKSAEIRSRIEPDLKQKSTEVLADLGLDLSAAIRLFLRQVVEVGGLPFEVRKPTPETVAAMMEARAMSAARFGSEKELFDGLDKQAGKGKARASAKKG
jgi:DNA-damage-inducible protein J